MSNWALLPVDSVREALHEYFTKRPTSVEWKEDDFN
ncbi:Imm1 family immunity protein [Actinokineospora iranica]